MFRDSLLPAVAFVSYKCMDSKGLHVNICPRCRDAVEVERDFRNSGVLIHYKFCVEHQNKYVNHYEN